MENEDEMTIEKDDKNRNMPKPPPIVISRVQDIKPLIGLLNEIANSEQYVLRSIIDSEQVKVQAKTSEAYSTITKALLLSIQCHTYKLKEDKSFRVVLKKCTILQILKKK